MCQINSYLSSVGVDGIFCQIRKKNEHNHKKREAKKREEQVQLEKIGVNQHYRIGAVIALGVIDGLGYYIYQSKKGPTIREVMMPVSQQQHPQTNKFEMD